MTTYKEFEILKTVIKGYKPEETKNILGYKLYKDEDDFQDNIESLVKKGYLVDNKVSNEALMGMAPCKVENAIILAAGGDDISEKSVYSMPKGLFVVNGEPLIERQIKQLKEAGINNIVVIVGYKQELYFYLQEKYGVILEVNPNLKFNNINSLYIARQYLGNSYILNCDNYYKENPFSAYEFNSFHCTVYKENAENELLVKVNQSGRITNVYSGAKEGECIYGFAYIDKPFAKRFVDFLEKEISNFRVTSLFWEEYVSKHIDDLDMFIRSYPASIVYEFDSIQEIQNINGLFLENVSEKVNEKICEVLNCTPEEINNIVILEKGLSNVLFTFYVRGEKYIYRYPGDSTAFFIYRKNEVRAMKIGAKAGADGTYIYIDESGAKISKFRENCKNLNEIYYKDVDLMKRIAEKIAAFHKEGRGIKDWKEYDYNPVYQCERLFTEASKIKGNMFEVFSKEWNQVRKLQKYADMDGIEHTMCHNDINQDNILLTDDTLDIIDWEFAGYNDPGYDFGRVIIGYDFDDKSIDEILEAYFGRPATEKERLHFISYAGIHCWYYVGWALYKESINESSRDWMIFFYKQSKRVFDYALPLYEKIYGKLDE